MCRVFVDRKNNPSIMDIVHTNDDDSMEYHDMIVLKHTDKITKPNIPVNFNDAIGLIEQTDRIYNYYPSRSKRKLIPLSQLNDQHLLNAINRGVRQHEHGRSWFIGLVYEAGRRNLSLTNQ